MNPIGVIGSGHAGITAAKALVARGHRPVILDVGEGLDSETQEVVDRLGRQSKTEWDDADLQRVVRNDTVFGDHPKRLAFGSDFVYAGNRGRAPLNVAEDGPSPSFARGGFSGVWGATMSKGSFGTCRSPVQRIR